MAIERLTPDDLDTVNEEKIIELGSREIQVGGQTYTINLRQKGRTYLVDVPKLENCYADGKSEEEVLKNIEGRIDMIHFRNDVMMIGGEDW